MIHMAENDWVVMCVVPLLDTTGRMRRYTEQAAKNEALRMEVQMKSMGLDVKYTIRRV
jgi:hypothetical protein